MKQLLSAFLLAATFLPSFAQQTKLLTAEKHNEYGLVYTLPVTALQVQVVAVKENKIAGPFSKYSKLFTGDVQVISEDGVEWSVESVSVAPYGVPDTENRYIMQLKPGALTYMSVADDGMLLAINTEAEAPEIDEVDVVKVEGSPVNGKEYLEFVDEDFVAATSSYKKAQILAEELMEVRDSKLSLTRGTAETMPTDGRQLEIMLTALENQEKALTNAFTGASWKERVVKTFTFIPEKEGRNVLCRVSRDYGIVEANDYSGDPMYVTVNIIEEPETPVDAKGVEKKMPKDAVVYNIPGTAEIIITFDGNVLYQRETEFSQFGITGGLNPSIFTDKKEPSYAVFNPATGALQKLATVK